MIVVVFPLGEKDGPKSLSELMADRQEQAEKSVLISCPSRTNEKKFLKFLSKHGDINKHFFYESYVSKRRRQVRACVLSCEVKLRLCVCVCVTELWVGVLQGVYAVVEFACRDSVASLLESAAIPSINHECMVPFKSRLLSLSNQSLAASPAQQPGLPCRPQATVSINELIQRLSREDSVSMRLIRDQTLVWFVCVFDRTDRILPALTSLQVDNQIGALTETYQLTEENSRLRFLVCSLLKDVAAAYFPECTIRPFGSSVNGFGKLGCDLDMFLDLDSISGWNFKPVMVMLALRL